MQKKRIALMIIFAMLAHGRMAYAEINKEKAIRGIMGEASNQGYIGMLALACAIRNRGYLRGVYGVNAKHIYKEPKYVWDMARKAWAESKTKDIVHGADHWENIKEFGVPYWAEGKKPVITIKDHAFYDLIK